MKKLFLMLLLPVYFQASAQTTSSEKRVDKTNINEGFQKEKLFTGGNVNLGFASGTTSLGISPQLGYSLTDWMDAGITLNVNYLSIRDYPNLLDKTRQTTFGPGAFVRLFPVEFLFASIGGEYNWTSVKYIPATSGAMKETYTVSAPSLLVGGGYAGGRQKGRNTYYYLSVMWDVAGDVNSPYVDGYGRSNPIIRAGYNIGLFQGRGRMNRGY